MYYQGVNMLFLIFLFLLVGTTNNILNFISFF